MDGINSIQGYGNYGVSGGYVPQRNENAAEAEAQAQPAVQNHEETLVDSSKVMEFMEANNIFVAPKTTVPAGLDPEVQARIEDYMARFEEIYALVVNEFGEDLAHLVMDLVMDKLIGA